MYGITDRSWLGKQTLAEQVEQALKGNVTMLQFREKLSGERQLPQLEQEARELQLLCRRYQVPFIINDYVELAEKIGADGVHLGQGDCSIEQARQKLGKRAIIGVTAKTVEQAQRAQRQGADYLGSGAVFGSTTKKDASVMELDQLRKICKAVTIPVVAIGGITRDNAELLRETGIAGVAVIGGIFSQENIEQATAELGGIVKGWESNGKE